MVVYTDGSAHPNPGPGGYGVVAVEAGRIIQAHSRQYKKVTNNEMELKALLYALIRYGQTVTVTDVYTDSTYVYNTFTTWMYSWQRKGWKKADKKEPENLPLVQALYQLVNSGYKINLYLTKGHSGTFGNEVADSLATGKKTAQQVIGISF